MVNSKHKTKSNAQNMPEGALPTSEELFSGTENPMILAMDNDGITAKKLSKLLKQELKARETKIIKVKGALKQEDLPKGFKIIAVSGVLSYDKQGHQVFGDGETIIRYDPKSLVIRQRAREGANKIRGDYAPEKHEVEVKKLIIEL